MTESVDSATVAGVVVFIGSKLEILTCYNKTLRVEVIELTNNSIGFKELGGPVKMIMGLRQIKSIRILS